MNKLKILNYHHLYSPSTGGVEENIYTFAKYSKHRHLVYTDLLPNTKNFELIGKTTVFRFGPAKHPVRRKTLDQAINLLLDLPREVNKAINLNRLEFDIMHLRASFTFPSLFYIFDHHIGRTIFKRIAAWRLCKEPIVVTFHSLPSHDLPMHPFFHDVPYYPQTQKWRRSWLEIEKMYCEKAEAIICVDRYMVEPLQRICPGKDIKHIPSAVRTDLFKPIEKEKAIKRLPPHIGKHFNKNRFVILYLGRLEHVKGAHLLRPLAKLLPDDCETIIAGHGNTRLVEDIPNSTFIGRIDDSLASLVYNCCDVVFNPVLWHGTSRVTFEAMACGKPVIMLNRAADRYPAVHRENVVIANTLNEAVKFIDELRFDSSLQDELCHNAKATARKYSVQNLAKQVDEIYQKVYRTRYG